MYMITKVHTPEVNINHKKQMLDRPMNMDIENKCRLINWVILIRHDQIMVKPLNCVFTTLNY